ncbi:MAG: hypothetical protein DLM66_02245 [Candidatus Dormiibacter spiritus]|nr:MAG: hypothetical protein DLM66_02245 [Candidatus Dormibacteraeota bacterium]
MSPASGGGPSSAELIGLGGMLAGSVIVPLVGGALLDGALHTGPLLLLVGLGVGIVAAAAVMYLRMVRQG